MKINPDGLHLKLRDNTKQIFAFDSGKNLAEQQRVLKDKFIELCGIDKIEKNACNVRYEVEFTQKRDGYILTRFLVETETDFVVPCYIAVPDTGKNKYPAIITLQGHTNGMYHSLGEVKSERDLKYTDSDFAVQAVKHGFAAIMIELRGMGELMPQGETRLWGDMCKYTAQTALMLGRTVIGERIWDVSRVIDVLPEFDFLDLSELIITGNSGGGTLSYYAACYDERIKLCAPSCAFCSYSESIIEMYHCACNYIPHAYEWFDMQDLACLIAPRKLLVVAGESDRIFPIQGVKRAYSTVIKVFDAANASQNCKLVTHPLAHKWVPDIMWKAIDGMIKNS